MMRHSVLIGAAVTAALITGCRRNTPSIEAVAGPAVGFIEAADPVLAADPTTGDILAAFVARGSDSTWRLYVARSADGGSRWTEAQPVSRMAGEVKPHGEASPRLVTAPNGQVALVWSQDFTVPGRKWPASRIRFSRSLDGGASWSAPVSLNDDTTAVDPPLGHTFHGATGDGAGGIVVAWLDERKGGAVTHDHGAMDSPDASGETDASIYSVRSTDFGATWSANQPLWGSVCPCCRVTLAPAPNGRIAAAWRKHFPGDVRDVVTGEVPDLAGEQLEPPQRIHADGWVFPGCPHTGPALAVGADGTRHVAWYTGRPGAAGVFLARERGASPTDLEPTALVKDSTLPPAHATVIALGDGSSLVAWDIAPGGVKRISVALVAAQNRTVHAVAVPASEGSSHPQLVLGAAGTALLAYTGLGPRGQSVRMARLRFEQENR